MPKVYGKNKLSASYLLDLTRQFSQNWLMQKIADDTHECSIGANSEKYRLHVEIRSHKNPVMAESRPLECFVFDRTNRL